MLHTTVTPHTSAWGHGGTFCGHVTSARPGPLRYLNCDAAAARPTAASTMSWQSHRIQHARRLSGMELLHFRGKSPAEHVVRWLGPGHTRRSHFSNMHRELPLLLWLAPSLKTTMPLAALGRMDSLRGMAPWPTSACCRTRPSLLASMMFCRIRNPRAARTLLPPSSSCGRPFRAAQCHVQWLASQR